MTLEGRAMAQADACAYRDDYTAGFVAGGELVTAHAVAIYRDMLQGLNETLGMTIDVELCVEAFRSDLKGSRY